MKSPVPAPSGPWDEFNLSPASRTVRPVDVFKTTGTVQTGAALGGEPISLVGSGSSATLDFGKEVGGFVSIRFGNSSSQYAAVGLTFSESSLDVSPQHSDHSNGLTNIEPVITHFAPNGGTISTASGDWSGAGSDKPGSQLRGGFRYLTVVNEGTGTLVLDDLWVDFTPAPLMKDPRAYPNYFYSNDELINRIWYAGAYTVQVNTIPAEQGRVDPLPGTGAPPLVGWDNAALVGKPGTSLIVDGAKRDRTVWPGDLGMQVPTNLVSLGDYESVRNSLQLMYDLQRPSGELPYSGPVMGFYGSDAYHMWTLSLTATYFDMVGDRPWLDGAWDKYKKAMEFLAGKIGDDGLLNGTGGGDWARRYAGGKNIELQALCYHVLTQAAELAAVKTGDDPSAADLGANWKQLASALKGAVNAPGTGEDGSGAYWNPKIGLYRNNTTGDSTALYPQDGNALAVWYGIAAPDRARAISKALTKRWTAIGATSPEKSATSIHPFPGGMEVNAHFAANDDRNGLDLIRKQWGYMLNAPQGTASTFWEGYKTDGSSDYTDTGPGFRAGSYLSMAHGWASGPTSALTFYVLGIHPGAADEPTYDLIPHPGNLTTVEGQLATPLGVIRQTWTRDARAGTFTMRFTAPDGAVRKVGVPTTGRSTKVWLDGRLVWNGKHSVNFDAHTDGTYVYLGGIRGGDHEVVAR